MRTSLLLTLLFFAVSLTITAQKQPINRSKIKNQMVGKEFPTYQVFSLEKNPQKSGPVNANLSAYNLLNVAKNSIQQLKIDAPESFSINIPAASGEAYELQLVKADIVADDFQVRLASTGAVQEVDPGIHYRGTIKGQEGSIAALSVYDDRISALMSDPKLGNLQVDKLSEDSQGHHIVYKQTDLKDDLSFSCETSDDGPRYTTAELQAAALSSADKCVRIFFEVDNDIYRDKGGTDGVVNYISGLFNQVATLYANDGVTVKISELLIWDTTSPYSGSSSSDLLNQFQRTRTSINGDLGQLLSYQASGGIAVVNGLCRSSTSLKLSFSSIGSSYRPFPNYSFTVMVVAHELGHLMGSYHTHSCAWNGNNTALDGCPGFTEGSCPTPGVPSDGGTIMSYCHLNRVGINFSKGFGDQPGNVIRNRVSASSCLQACTPDDGGGDGGGPTSCDKEELSLAITLDNYGSEVTWDLKDADGNVVASGGPYADGANGTVIRENVCVESGCYTLTMKDAYGDGLCCAYGNGKYELTDKTGKMLASGNQYGREDATDFCLTEGPNPSDCDGEYVVMALTLDNFGSETSWDVKNQSGEVLYSGGPYQDKTGGRVVRDTFCLPNGCNMFTVYDEYGDGICCEFSSGAVQLTSIEGETLLNGAKFEDKLEKELCVDSGGGEGGGGGDSNCTNIDFNTYQVISFGGAQDKGDFEVQDGGATLFIQNNAWKAIDLDYQVTANTVIAFDFKSTIEGEILGIGFDEDNGISSSYAFKLYGTQNWGFVDYDDYPGNGEWKSYAIPVGQFYTGAFTKVFFMGDHDGNGLKGNAYFRNLRIHEGTDCSSFSGNLPGNQPSGVVPSKPRRPEQAAPNSMELFPNPAGSMLNLRFQNDTDEQAILEIYAPTGQLINRRTINTVKGLNLEGLDISALRSGSYILNLQTGKKKFVQRFQVVK